jgi:hypothetical protein
MLSLACLSRPQGWSTTLALALTAALGGAACGSSHGTPSSDGAVGPGDADTHADAGADVATCAALPCLASLASLIASCAPSGTCTEQVTASATTATQAKCFSSGVKISLTGTDSSTMGTTAVMAVQKDGAACYSFTYTTESPIAVPTVYKDGAGADLLTITMANNIPSYTCPGGSPVVPDSSCDAALFALQGLYPFTNASCSSGTCAF